MGREPPHDVGHGLHGAKIGHTSNPRHYRYYDLVMAGFVTVLLCSNLIGPGKTCLMTLPLLGMTLTFGAGNLFFPISYIFGDVLTEVYGYARARKVIWAGFAAMIFATLMSFAVIHFPTDPKEPYNEVIQPALVTCFGNTWRIVLGSILAFWVGDFANSYVLAKMKVWTAGRFLWARTIGSTIIGQGIDSLIFYPIAFAGIWDERTLLSVILFNWGFKVAVEALFTPMTYLVVGFLKRAEQEDYYDRRTNFTPFSLKD
ncbi:MAG: queuosine precursor transporter [Phycisphaerales bacterium]|nr:queuosine precursor transporter [Phycisphaerales bacterium]